MSETSTAVSATASPTVPDTGPILLHELVYLAEGDEVTVGRPDIESYVVLDADGAELIRRIGSGLSAAEAAAWYEDTYHESVDIDDFVQSLDELGFIRRPEEKLVQMEPVRFQRLGQIVFSRPAMICYFAIIATALVEMVLHRHLRPSNSQLFFTRYMTVMELVIFLGQFPLLLLHEAAHALAGRRIGIRSWLSIGRRLYFIVFLTALDGLVAVPRRKRFLPMAAGMLCDAVVVSVLTLFAEFTRSGGHLTIAGKIALALAFSTVLRLLWQLYFYLETDIYYIFVTVIGCINLQAVSRAMLRNRWNRLRGRHDQLVDAEEWHPRDRAIARWYSWLLLLGWVFSIGSLLVVGLPVMVRVLGHVIGRIVDSGTSSIAGLTDSITFIVINLAQVGLICWLVLRERRAAKAAGSRASVAHSS